MPEALPCTPEPTATGDAEPRNGLLHSSLRRLLSPSSPPPGPHTLAGSSVTDCVGPREEPLFGHLGNGPDERMGVGLGRSFGDVQDFTLTLPGRCLSLLPGGPLASLGGLQGDRGDASGTRSSHLNSQGTVLAIQPSIMTLYLRTPAAGGGWGACGPKCGCSGSPNVLFCFVLNS